MKYFLLGASIPLVLIICNIALAVSSSTPNKELLRYKCAVAHLYEDGSALSRDAEVAQMCMKNYHVWKFHLAHYKG